MFKHFAIIFAVLFVVALTEAGRGSGKPPARPKSPQKPDGTNNPHPPSGTYTGHVGEHRSISPGGSRHKTVTDQTGQQWGGTEHSGGTNSVGYLHKPHYGGPSDSPPRPRGPPSPKHASTSGRRGGK